MYRYKYQRHPFDDPQFFTVRATSQEEADSLARVEFQRLFDSRQTVMVEFYRA
jgi:hypothetical protein